MARNFANATDKLEATLPLGARPGAAGTIFFIAMPSWSSGDGITHVFCEIANDVNNYLDFQKFSDNNIYVGWTVSAVDYRLVVADTGIFTANTFASYAFRWDIAGGGSARQELLKNGISAGVRTGAFFTGGFPFLCIGNYSSVLGVGQSNSAKARLAPFPMWNVWLSDAEILALTAGARPRDIRPRSLFPYYPLDGIESPEPDLSGNAANLTVTGAIKGRGPPVNMFTRPPTVQISVAVEILRPGADISDGSWTTDSGGTTLYAAIDEIAADDADYIQSSLSPANDACEVSLSNPVNSLTTPLKVRYRYKKSEGEQIDLTVNLVQGTTVITTWTHTDIGTTITAAEQTLSAPEAASITDFTDLRLRFTANAP